MTAIASFAIAAAAVGCSSGTSPATAHPSGAGGGGGTVVIRNFLDYTNLDFQTQLTSGNSPLTAYAYDSLVAFNVAPDGKQAIVPYLAQSWTTTPTSVTFTLKKGPKCQDGTPITPAVVKASLDRMLQVSKNLTSHFGGTQGAGGTAPTGTGPYSVTINNEANTVTFTASKPNNLLVNGFMAWTSLPGSWGAAKIVCPSGLTGDASQLQAGMYGSGPYRMVSAVRGDKVVLKLWPDWTWGPNGTTAKAAGMPDTIVFSIVPNDSTAANLALTDQIDVLTDDAGDGQRLVQSGHFQAVHTPPVHGVGFPWGQITNLFFNTPHAPLDNLYLRQALTMVLDQKLYNDAVYQGQADVIASSALPTSPCFDPAAAKLVKTGASPDTARALLLAHGFTSRNGQIFNPDGSRTSFGFMASSVQTTSSEYVISQWQKVGVDAKLEVLDPTTYALRAIQGKWDSYIGGTPSIGYFSGPYPSEGGLNLGAPHDPAYESEVAQALSAPTTAAACPHWKNIQRMIAEGAWMLPLVTGPNITYVRKGIRFQIWGGNSPLGSVLSWRVSKLDE